MNKRKLLFLSILSVIFNASIFAQINPKGVAPGLVYNKVSELQSVYPLTENVEKLIAEDELGLTPGLPERVAISIPINADFFSMGEWISLANGGRFYQVRLLSPNAKNICLAFDKFALPENAQLFFYSPDKETLFGGFTHDDNHNSLAFTSPITNGEEIIVEYYEPDNNRVEGSAVLHISELAHFYQHAYETDKNSNIGASEECHININCPEGDDWQTEKRGVARILMKVGSGWGWCSGTLINNTKQDGKPYFLTAEHCGGSASDSDRSQWVFRFGFERPGCEDSGIPATKNITGCSLIAKGLLDGGSDMQLLELNFTPPSSFEPYYNGWDRSIVPPASGVGIHHPAGDVKKISTYTQTATSVANPIISGTSMASHSAWNVIFTPTQTGHGVTQGGSSGSPMFNHNKLVSGTLTGGNSSCSYLYGNNIYGKLSYHWETNGTESNQQLKPWLDPLNTGQITLQGLDPYPVPAPQNLNGEISENNSIVLTWEPPKYQESDNWFAHVNNYSSVRHDQPERAVKYSIVNDLNLEVFYIKKISHLFWEHPSFPWGSNNSFTFRVYDQDGSTLLYESPTIEAHSFQTNSTPVVHVLDEPIAVFGDFFISVAPLESGQPSSLSLTVDSPTNSYYGSAGNWTEVNESGSYYEYLTNVYGSDNNSSKLENKSVNQDGLIRLGVTEEDWFTAAQLHEKIESKTIVNLQGYQIFRNNLLIHETSSGDVLTYTDSDLLPQNETITYHLKAIYNLNPPNAQDIISGNSNEIEIILNAYDLNISIKDIESTPLPNAYISIFDSEDNLVETLITDENGFATINLGAGEYLVEAKKIGYSSASLPVEIVDQELDVILTLDDVLSPYTASFTITDENLQPIENASISILTTVLLTNSVGEVIFNGLEQGFYSYQIQADGYHLYEGEFEITDENIHVDIALNLITYDILFAIKDESSQPISGALVSLDENTIITDINGNAEFEGYVPNVYNYSVSAAGFYESTGQVNLIDENIVLTVNLEIITYSVTVTVLNEDQVPIENADVSLDGTSLISGSNGVVVFNEVVPGTYDLNISADGYNTYANEITVNESNLDLNIELIQIPTYNAYFYVKTGDSEPINNAEIEINQGIFYTNSQGEAIITGLYNGTYPYQISANSYEVYSSELTIENSDFDEYVTLISTSVETTSERLISLYPNPTNGMFTIITPFDWKAINVKIIDITGRLIHDRDYDDLTSIDINLSGNSSGIYIVKISSNDKIQFSRLIIAVHLK